MPLLCEIRGQVAILTLSRPEARNAWCDAYNEGFIDILPKLEADKNIRCVILTGDPQGNAFSAGADLKNPMTHAHASMADFLEELPSRRRTSAINLVTDFSNPIIAAVNGYAIGIGCIVTYCCDLIVASEKAEWRLPQSRLGIMPAQGGSVRAARWVGKGMAARMAYGFPLPAEEAYRIGLLNHLVPRAELRAKTMWLAKMIAASHRGAVMGIKQLMLKQLGQDLAGQYAEEIAYAKNVMPGARAENAFPDFIARKGRALPGSRA